MEAKHRVIGGLACLFAMMALFVGAAQAQTSASGKALEFADPKTTYRTFLAAVRKNDLQAAIRCWVIDDDNKSSALDVIVGWWVSGRRLNELVKKEFGQPGVEAIEGLADYNLDDSVLDRAEKRLDDAVVTIRVDLAELKWKQYEQDPNQGMSPEIDTVFRKISGNWKIDANRTTGLKKGEQLFAPGTFGPSFREALTLMRQLIAEIEARKIKSAKELKSSRDTKLWWMSLRLELEALKLMRNEALIQAIADACPPVF
jgi:hypothetical protein